MSGTPLASPCIGVCEMDGATGWCAGCLRTLDEIAGWAQWGDAERRAVWLALPGRRVQWRQLHRTDAGAPRAAGPA